MDWLDLKMSKEARFILVLLAIYAVILGATTVNINRMAGDAGNHASAGLLVYEVASQWLSNPFAPLASLKETALVYHAHYKSFASFLTYTPAHHIFLGINLLLLGASRFTLLIPTIMESLVLLYFLYLLSHLSYKHKQAAFLAVFFLAFNPIYFFQSTLVMLEIGASMFMVMAIYYFSLYMMKNESRHLYLASACTALAILTRPNMVLILPILLLTFIWERKKLPTKPESKRIAVSIILFLLVMSPWLAFLGMLHSEGLSGYFLSKWTAHASGYEDADVAGFPVADATLQYYTGLPLHKYALYFFSTVFYQWYLIPFFLLAIYTLSTRLKRLNVVEKQAILSIIVFGLYLGWINMSGTRYIFPVLPFVCLLVSGPVIRVIKRMDHPLMVVMMVLAVAQCSQFLVSIASNEPIGNLDTVSMYVIEDSPGETSVLSTQPRSQAVSFALLDTQRKIYVFYPPSTQKDFERMLDGTYTEAEWTKLGIEYPQIDYVIVDEKSAGSSGSTYSISESLKERGDFQLLKTVSGSTPNTRMFIYKRK